MRDTLHHPHAPRFATVFIAIASFLALYSLNAMVELGSWRWTTAGLLALTTAAIVVTRQFAHSKAVPTLVGAGVAFLAAIAIFSRTEAGAPMLFPTPGSVKSLVNTINGGFEYAATTVAPAPVTHELLAVLSLGLIILFLVAEHIAVSWRAAGVAGIVLIAPWMPAVALQHRVSVPMLLLAIACWIVCLGLTRKITASDRTVAPASIATTTLATLLLVLLVTPTALGGNGWGMFPRFGAPADFDTATRLNLDLDLRNSLNQGSEATVMRYTTSGGRPEVLRLYALSDFDGAAWDREDPPAGVGFDVNTALWSVAPSTWDPASLTQLNIQILNLAETNLPVPAVPRSVSVGPEWSYVRDQDEIVTDGNGTQNLNYSVLALDRYLDAQVLSSLGQPPAEDPSAGVGSQYLDIPAALDLDRVRNLALEVTSDSLSRYDQALAVQTHLRNSRDFTYDTTVQPTGSDSVSAFLDSKRGYCVQFATTMVMMMRSLDVPARLAVGFLPGDAQADGSFLVFGADAHAWPEVWFPDVGWVRFEPTPARQSGAVPTHADPASGSIPVPQSVIDAAQQGGDIPQPTALPAPNEGRPQPGDAVVPPSSQPVSPGIVAGVAALILLAVIAVWLTARRRKHQHLAEAGIEAQWARLRAEVGADVDWPLTLTPHEAVERLRGEWARLLGEGESPALDALVRVGTAVEQSRYAPAGTATTEDQVRVDVSLIVAELANAKKELAAKN